MEKEIYYLGKAVLTTVKEHDRNQLEVMVDDIECMYVFTVVTWITNAVIHEL